MQKRSPTRGKVRLHMPLTDHYKYVHPIHARAVQLMRFSALMLTLTGLAYIYGNTAPAQTDLAQAEEVREVVVEKIVEKVVEKVVYRETIDQYIADSVEEFLPHYKSEATMIMHCLAHRESRHGANKGCGDNGMACGPMQFWAETWVRMRKQMIAQGHAEEVGDRLDLKESVRTTAWAIANGRALEWGPILRTSKGNNQAACPVPSWMK
jgi:hypothetical protein